MVLLVACFQKREVTIQRVDGVLGISVRGGAEHSLPLIVSRLIPGSPAALCKQIYIGDAVIASKFICFNFGRKKQNVVLNK